MTRRARNWRQSWLRGLTLLCGGLLACSSSKPEQAQLPVDRVWSSTHFRYLSRADDDSVCEPILSQLERHFETMQSFLGFHWPMGQRIDYFKFRDADDVAANGTCSELNESCFFAGLGLQSAAAFETHELIHAYLAPLGDRHRLFEEGLANALSCGHELRAKPEPLSPQEAFSPTHWRTNTRKGFTALYDNATWFVGWLVNQGGPDRFMDLFERASPSLDFNELGWLFEEIYGSSLSLAWQVAFSSDEPDVGCVRAFECASADWFDVHASESCEHRPSVHTLTLDKDSWVIQHSTGFGSMLGSCQPGTRLPHEDWFDPLAEGQRGEVFALLLPAGKYFVTSSPRFAEVRLHVFDAGSELGNPRSCGEALPLPVAFNGNLTIALAPSLSSTSVPQWLPWNSSAADAGLGYEVSCSSGVVANWCLGCADCASACDTHVAIADEIPQGSLEALSVKAPSDRGGWVRLVRTH